MNTLICPAKKQNKPFLKQVPSEVLKEAEDVDKEADEVERLNELQGKELEGKDEISKAMGEAKRNRNNFNGG